MYNVHGKEKIYRRNTHKPGINRCGRLVATEEESFGRG
jgi:hypothetical protein